MHVVGFTVEIYYYARSYECQLRRKTVYHLPIAIHAYRGRSAQQRPRVPSVLTLQAQNAQ